MNQAVYLKLKGIVIQDLIKNPRRVSFHERELKSEGLTPEYRRAVEEALEELRVAQRRRG
ncbi:hypothetical protein LJR074_004182 [Acidovorax sp. LjRoot74]|uniref:hypothetical protein n=1 Tax=Acidovorax sp. LjRoot74 TaxID=3342337 RepID=UPI003ECEEDC2